MNAATTTTPTTVALDEAIRFVWQEADILDRLAYRDWLPLWHDQGTYIIPIERGAKDYRDALNIVYDDHDMREARVKRLLSGFSMSSAPPARTVRTVSRFVVTAQEPAALSLRCAQILVEYKYERTRTLAADVDYRLIRIDGELRIERKVVRLVNSDEDQFGIGYLL